jgi:hypothetical protein
VQSGSTFEFDDDATLDFGTDNDVSLYFDGTDFFIDNPVTGDFVVRGGTSGTDTYIRATADGGVNLYYDNEIAVNVVDRTATGKSTAVDVRTSSGVLAPVGLGIRIADTNPTGFTLSESSMYETTVKNDTTAFTITCEASGSQLFNGGAEHKIINAGASGDITIADGGEVLTYLDGSSATDVGADCTLGVGGEATLYRASTTQYYIWGSGITS